MNRKSKRRCLLPLCILALVAVGVATGGDLITDTLRVNQEARFHGPVAIAAPTGTIPLDGLVLYYDFNADQTNVVDGSGNGHNGYTLGGMAWTTNGLDGGCFEYDGTNDYINSGLNLQSIVRAGAISFSIWFNTNDGDDGYQYLFGTLTTSPSANRVAALLYPSGGQGRLDLTVMSTGSQYSIWPATTMPDGPSGWQHLVWTVDDAANQLRAYLNGVEEPNSPRNISMSLSAYTNTYPLFVGARNYNGSPDSGPTQYFKGRLDEFRIYDRVISAEEVAELYYAQVPAHPQSGELTARTGVFTEGVVYQPPLGDLSMGVYTNQP